jgi:hypothetical protein
MRACLIVEPPPKGWPHINEHDNNIEKSKEVIELLRHLPYIKYATDSITDVEGAIIQIIKTWKDNVGLI